MVGSVRIDRNAFLLPEIEGPHIVQAHDVVGVGVGEEDGIHAIDARRGELDSGNRGWCR